VISTFSEEIMRQDGKTLNKTVLLACAFSLAGTLGFAASGGAAGSGALGTASCLSGEVWNGNTEKCDKTATASLDDKQLYT
jgi:hypothetical protein